MKKTVIFAAITTAIGMASTGITHADGTISATPPQLEKCQVNKDGKSFIKEHMADCQTTSTHSCMGNNTANDTESWVFVPQGECAKINACDFSGMTDNIKTKLDMDALNQACSNNNQATQPTDGSAGQGSQGTQGTQPMDSSAGQGSQGTQGTQPMDSSAGQGSQGTQGTQPMDSSAGQGSQGTQGTQPMDSSAGQGSQGTQGTQPMDGSAGQGSQGQDPTTPTSQPINKPVSQ